MTIANKLTLFRILVLPIILSLFLIRKGTEAGDIFKVLATILFIIAAITDFFDGAYARANKEVTNFGKIMDPVADKMLISTGYLCLLELADKTQVAGWMVAVILFREFLISTLRILAATEGVVISASTLGKYKVAAQLTATISALVFLSTEIIFKSFALATPAAYFIPFYPGLLFHLHLVAVFFTALSGADYLIKYRHYFQMTLPGSAESKPRLHGTPTAPLCPPPPATLPVQG